MRKDKYHPPFEADTIYHLYNHAIGNEWLFRSPENYRFFLQRYGEYVPQIADTFAYCLMPNHFHFLIRTKKEEELVAFFEEKEKSKALLGSAGWGNPPNLQKPLHQLLGQQFGNFFNAYTKSFNKMYERKGGLFADDVCRLVVGDEAYFCNTLRYIHLNPIHHGFVKELADWEHTSYASYCSDKHTKLCKAFTLAVFGGIKGFKEAHSFDGLDINGIPFD